MNAARVLRLLHRQEAKGKLETAPLLTVFGTTDQRRSFIIIIFFNYFLLLVILHYLSLCMYSHVYIRCVVAAFEETTAYYHCAYIAQSFDLHNLLKGDNTLTSHRILHFSGIRSTMVHKCILFTNLLERRPNFFPFLAFTVCVYENVK